jgi:putative lipoic acid-binding regulatory protein
MCEEGYLRSSSRSRYLSASVRLRVRDAEGVTLPRKRLSARRG